MVGVPVIINHKDLNNDNVDNERVGVVNSVWYDEKDGWYWCDGIIWNETAQNLITDQNWSVSCSYDVKTANDEGGSENNIKYDMEFLDGVFTHLALVNNPRYERANIVFNSKTVIENGGQGSGHHHHAGIKGFHGGSLPNGVNSNYIEEIIPVIELAKQKKDNSNRVVFIGPVQSKLIEEAKENGFDLTGYKHNIDVYGIRHSFNEHANKDKEESRGQVPITDEDIKEALNIVYSYDKAEFGEKNDQGRDIIKLRKQLSDGYMIYIEEIRTGRETLTLQTIRKFKNNVGNSNTLAGNSRHVWSDTDTNIINDIINDFNPDVKENKEMDINNSKENDMAIIDELKKLITKVENEKGDDMANDKEKKEVENEKVDKRKLIDEVGGILKGKVDDEVIRTIIGKLEKVAYDKSEAGTADNEKEEDAENCKKVKNEEKEEPEKDKEEVKEVKEEVKEDVENKCKNSVDNSKEDYFEKLNKIYNSASSQVKEKTEYVSRADREKAAEDYFAR